MDYAALAKMYGGVSQGAAPAQPVAQHGQDWMNELSMKSREELRMQGYKDARKRIDALDAEVTKGGNINRELEQFGELNKKTRTGDVWDSYLPDVPALHGQDIDEMYAIQARLAPAMREVGAGSSTDKDVALFMAGLPGVDKDGPSNKRIREDFNKKYELAVKKKTMMEQYLGQNGSLDGFDNQWADYVKRSSQPAAPKQNPAPRAFNMLPNAGEFDGKTATDTVNGKKYRSRGGKWVEVK